MKWNFSYSLRTLSIYIVLSFIFIAPVHAESELIDGFNGDVDNWKTEISGGDLSLTKSSDFVKEGSSSMKMSFKYSTTKSSYFKIITKRDFSAYSGIKFWLYVPSADPQWQLRIDAELPSGKEYSVSGGELDGSGWKEYTFPFFSKGGLEMPEDEDITNLKLYIRLGNDGCYTCEKFFNDKRVIGEPSILYIDDLRGILKSSSIKQPDQSSSDYKVINKFNITGIKSNIDISNTGSIVYGTYNIYGTNNNVLLVDKNGNILWKYSTLNPRKVAISATGDSIIFSDSDKIFALDKNGKLKWDMSTSADEISISADGEYVAAIKSIKNWLLEWNSVSMKGSESFLFSWDDVPGKGNSSVIEFLIQYYGDAWVRTAKIEKVDGGNTLKIYDENNSIFIRLNNEKTKANLALNDHGSDVLLAKNENGRLNIYSDFIRKKLKNALGLEWIENAEIIKTEDNKTIRASTDKNWLEITLDDEKKKAILKISDGRTIDLYVENISNRLNIYITNNSLYFLKNGKLLWKSSLSFVADSVSVSPNGSYISVMGLDDKFSSDEAQKSRIYLFDNQGKLVQKFNKDLFGYAKSVAGENNIVVGSTGVMLLDYNMNKKWDKTFLREMNAIKLVDYYLAAGNTKEKLPVDDIDSSSNNDLIVTITGDKYINFVNKLGDLIQTHELEKPANSIVSSADGNYVAVKSGDNELYIFTNYNVVALLSPSSDAILNNTKPNFKWTKSNASKYILKIDNETFTTTNSEFTLDEPLNTGRHQWSVKVVDFSGNEGDWLSPRTFSIVSSEEMNVTKKIVEEKPFDPRITAGGAILFLFLAGIIARPFYKRWVLKKKMAQTPTDWCPHCHKFTGGAKVCPHCGKETLASIGYDMSKKVKKKDKEGIVTPLDNISIPEKVEPKTEGLISEKDVEELKEEPKAILNKKTSKTGESSLRKKRTVKPESSKNTVKGKSLKNSRNRKNRK